MFCRKCGKQIPDISNICPYCGTPVTIRPPKTDSTTVGGTNNKMGSTTGSGVAPNPVHSAPVNPVPSAPVNPAPAMTNPVPPQASVQNNNHPSMNQPESFNNMSQQGVPPMQGVSPMQGMPPIQTGPTQGEKKLKTVIFLIIAALIAAAVIIAVLFLPKLMNGKGATTDSSFSQGASSSRLLSSDSGDNNKTSSDTGKEANSGNSSSASPSENAGSTAQNLEIKLPSTPVKTYHAGGEWTITKLDYSIGDTTAGPVVIVKINAVCDATSYPQDSFIIYYEIYEEGKETPVVPSTVFVGGKGTPTTTVSDEIRIGNLQKGKTYRFNISEVSLKPATEPQNPGQQQTDRSSVDYILPTSSSEYLDRAVIAALSNEDLRLARNEIYARHGRKFNSEDLQAYFNSKAWYKPTIEAGDFDTNGGNLLNDFEKVNLVTIQQVEAEREQQR